MDKSRFLGKGIKFPIQINPATGRFIMSEGADNVKESLYIILMTQRRERWLHPEFGSNILSYTFMDTSITRINMLSRELEQTIMNQEPRISQVDVEVEMNKNQGSLILNISYRLAENNSRDNLVFPFYLYRDGGNGYGNMEE